jgi:hypothetical protein
MRRLIIHMRRLNAQAADAGITTVEYAVGLAVGALFAGILLKIIGSSAVMSALTALVTKALR